MAEKVIDVALESTSQELKTLIESLQTALGNGLSAVKSVQRGVIAIQHKTGEVVTKTATISAVNVNKAVLVYGGHSKSVEAGAAMQGEHIELTNSTTITAKVSCPYWGGDAYNHYLPYQVIEFA